MTGRPWFVRAALCYALLAALTWTFEGHAAQRLEPQGQGQFRKFRQPSQKAAAEDDDEDRPAPLKVSGGALKVPFARVTRVHGGYELAYGFRTFDGQNASVEAQLDQEAVAQSIREYGFHEDDFKNLDAWYKKAREDAIAEAEGKYVRGQIVAKSREALEEKVRWINELNAKNQAALEKRLNELTTEYRNKRNEVYTKAGFRFKDGKTVEADIPAMAKRNWKRVRPVAQSFARLAQEKGFDAEDLVGAVVAMVQTSLRYEVPDTKEGSRVIGGAMPPPQTLVLGQGDCDTKTAVISSILLNWPNIKLVGLAIPGHYLMAYNRTPRSGEVFLEYEGLKYVMIESAGPAWLAPGTVGDQTQAYLDSGQDFRIQPISL